MPQVTDKHKILFVDDEPKVLMGLRRNYVAMLGLWDMEFVTSAADALQKLGNSDFDVMITDISMPGMSGLDLLKVVNRDHPRTQCIVLTGTNDLQLAEALINAVRVYRFYTKPCDADVLKAGICDAVNAGRAMSDSRGGIETMLLDRLNTGILVTDANGRVRYMNSAATSVLTISSLLQMAHSGQLRTKSPETSALLLNVIEKIARRDATETRGISLSDDDVGERLHLIIAPLDEGDGAMLFVTEVSRRPLPTAAIIKDLLGLTEAEAKLVACLVQGDTVKEASSHMDITESSARTYLKRILSKLQVSRQSELIGHVLTTTLPK